MLGQDLCSICLDAKVNPVVLPCLHTFCAECIENLQALSPSNAPWSKKCPLCRAPVFGVQAGDDIEEWQEDTSDTENGESEEDSPDNNEEEAPGAPQVDAGIEGAIYVVRLNGVYMRVNSIEDADGILVPMDDAEVTLELFAQMHENMALDGEGHFYLFTAMDALDVVMGNDMEEFEIEDFDIDDIEDDN